MGPSGAGKTTLMSALNGYSPPGEGLVLLNGQDLYEHFAQFADLLGYVPQDNIMHRELTVGQALYYTARLRLPPDTTDDEIHARISAVLRQLGLEGTVNTLIGSPERKGISGGQRKRVNLAMELLTDPAVLFLDEPTSGLSSEDALTVMTLLRNLADSGKSILLTIHQPSLEAYRLLDNVVIISKDPQGSEPGQLVYYGPAYPDAMQFFNPDKKLTGPGVVEPSPDELLRRLARRPTQQWSDRYEESNYKRDFVTGRANQAVAPADATPVPVSRASIGRQWATLFRRCMTIKIADRWNTAILLAQAPVVALAVVLVFGGEASRKITVESWQQVNGATGVTVFLLGLSALWFGCSNSVREIVGEWAIYQRERMVNLRIPAYVFSKLAVSAVLCLVQCTVLIGAARWGSNLRAPLLSSFLVMMLIACTGIGIGLILSAIARTSEVAIAMLPLTLIPMVIFGGILLPVYKMKAPIKVLAYAMPSRSGFEAMMLQESQRKPLGPSPYSGVDCSGHGRGRPRSARHGRGLFSPQQSPGHLHQRDDSGRHVPADRDRHPRHLAGSRRALTGQDIRRRLPRLIGRRRIDADRFQAMNAVVHVGVRAKVVVDLLRKGADHRAIRFLFLWLLFAPHFQVLAETTRKLQRLVARLSGGNHSSEAILIGLVFLFLGIRSRQDIMHHGRQVAADGRGDIRGPPSRPGAGHNAPSPRGRSRAPSQTAIPGRSSRSRSEPD